MVPTTTITNLREVLAFAERLKAKWGKVPWWRGQPECKPLLPGIFRVIQNEQNLTLQFMHRAPVRHQGCPAQTPRTLRAYFILVGILGSLVNFAALSEAVGGFVGVVSLIGLGFSIAYLYLGLRLGHLLDASPRQVTSVLFAGAAFLVLLFIIYAFLGVPIDSFTQPLVGLVFTWYLIVNVRRLAAQRTHSPNPPGGSSNS